jgi:hypothetical protein
MGGIIISKCRQPSMAAQCPIVYGVTVCPRNYESFWSWGPFSRHPKFKIYCDCRAVVKFDRPGIYRVLSTKGAPGGDSSKKDCIIFFRRNRDTPIHLVRVFPAVARAIQYDNTPGVLWGDTFFPHERHSCDLILAVSKSKNAVPGEPIIFRPDLEPPRAVEL